jgi:CheY-like chemotaxis protein
MNQWLSLWKMMPSWPIFFRRRCGRPGFTTVVAENGRTALTLLQNQTPALIVLDLAPAGCSRHGGVDLH